MTNPDTPPVVPSIGYVNHDPTKDQLEAALRQFILAVGPLVALFGVQNTDRFTQIALAGVGIAATIITVIVGQIKTRALASKAAQMANRLPDQVAQTK